VGGGVTVAQEVLVASDAVRALIREGKTPQLDNVMQTGSKYGMQTLEDALNNLIGINAITVETALSFANVHKRIKIDGAAAAAASTHWGSRRQHQGRARTSQARSTDEVVSTERYVEEVRRSLAQPQPPDCR
jgi:hypothetical protein